jgi:spore germination protein GerM
MKTQYAHLTDRGVIVGFSLLLLMVAGGTSWWAWQTATSTPVSQLSVPSQPGKVPVLQQEQEVSQSKGISPSSQEKVSSLSTKQSVPPASLQRKELQPKIYWLKVEGQQIRLLPKAVALNSAVSPKQALMEGMIHLLSHPKTNDLVSAIPAGTRLLSLRITSAGIYVNLSREFSQGGGSSSMIYRVAQILYTVTSLDSTAKVYLSVEGQRLDENHPLGGEGLMLRQPLTRQQFAEDFPLS